MTGFLPSINCGSESIEEDANVAACVDADEVVVNDVVDDVVVDLAVDVVVVVEEVVVVASDVVFGSLVVVFGISVVVVVTSGKTVAVMGGNFAVTWIGDGNFGPKGSAQLVSVSESFLFIMSSNGVVRSSMTSPESSQII